MKKVINIILVIAIAMIVYAAVDEETLEETGRIVVDIAYSIGSFVVDSTPGAMGAVRNVLNEINANNTDNRQTQNGLLPNQGAVEGDIQSAPPVDAGRQGKHVSGHNNHDPERSQWPEGQTGVRETQEGWKNGQLLPDGTIVWDVGRVIGSNDETGVRVHKDNNGRIHGYPVNPERYLSR